MYDTDTKSQFLELRAKGWSLARIAERLKVSQRTLVNWNRQEHEEIRTLRAAGWRVLRVLEHELKHRNEERVPRLLRKFLG